MAKAPITIVVTCRDQDSPEITLKSILEQNFQDYELVVVRDEGRGACFARNKGWRKSDTEYTLFSDNDIMWYKDGISRLYNILRFFPDTYYSYGAYNYTGTTKIIGDQSFDADKLREGNYISTMSLVRTRDFCGFDENIEHYQDWDAWLTMLDQGKRGIYCGTTIFSTYRGRHGYTREDLHRFAQIVKDKHAKA